MEWGIKVILQCRNQADTILRNINIISDKSCGYHELPDMM